MKNILIAILSLWGCTAMAQETVSEDDIAALMKHRMFSCFEVEYNGMQVAEDLFEAGKYDSLDALVSFWQGHCEPNERIFSLGMLNSIRNGTFRERISGSLFLSSRVRSTVNDTNLYRYRILSMMQQYKEASSGSLSSEPYNQWLRENYRLPKDATEYYNLYENYYDFLKYMARTMLARREYPPLEQYFLRFYARPDTVRYAEIDSMLYNGTVLQKEYKAYWRYFTQVHGGDYGITVGAWAPFGRLSVFGGQPYIGLNLGGRSYKAAWDLVVGGIAGKSPTTIAVPKDDSIYTSDHFGGLYIGMDVAHMMWRKKRHEFDILWGVGYTRLDLLYVKEDPDDSKSTAITQNTGSCYANVGLCYRFYVRHSVAHDMRRHSYLALQARYHMADFSNRGGTDVHGNYVTIGLTYGAYAHRMTLYPFLK